MIPRSRASLIYFYWMRRNVPIIRRVYFLRLYILLYIHDIHFNMIYRMFTIQMHVFAFVQCWLQPLNSQFPQDTHVQPTVYIPWNGSKLSGSRLIHKQQVCSYKRKSPTVASCTRETKIAPLMRAQIESNQGGKTEWKI